MTKPIVVFPDAVLVVVEYLRASLPGVAVRTQVPDPRPDEFIRVKRLGGARATVITDRPRVDIHCWSSTEDDAESLMRLSRAYVLAMAGSRSGTTVYNVREVGGPQWLPDSTSGQPRYAFAVEFSARGMELE